MTKWLIKALAVLTLAGTAISALAANEIRMVSSRSNGCPPVSGCFATPFFDAFLEVQNLAYAKNVGVRYLNQNGVWVNEPGEYTKSIGGNRELWRVSLASPPAAYAFYYTVNGVTYWDNNGGANYAAAPYKYDGILGTLPVGEPRGYWVESYPSTGAGEIKGDVLVKNLSYTKQVKVVYTLDNWATSQETQATFATTLPSGFEAWTFSIPSSKAPDFAKVQIAFYYTWATGSAWDNNYGTNYRMHWYGQIVR